MMQLDLDYVTSDVVAMNITMAALDAWLRGGVKAETGEQIGREVGAMYREIFAAVDETVSGEDDEDAEIELEDEAARA